MSRSPRRRPYEPEARAGRLTLDETSGVTLAQTPGPDLAYKDAVMGSRAFMGSITVAYPHAVAPGQAGMSR